MRNKLILTLRSKGSTENFGEKEVIEFRIDYDSNIKKSIKEAELKDYSGHWKITEYILRA